MTKRSPLPPRKFFLTTLALTLGICPAPLYAGEGFYLQAGAGGTYLMDSDSSGDVMLTPQSISYDVGFVGTTALGYDYGNGLRNELELGYRQNDISDITQSNSQGGRVKAGSVMYNLLYNLDLTDTPGLTPYVGIGGGMAYVNFDTVIPVDGSIIDDSDLVGAFQGTLGVSYELSNSMDFYFNYQYFTARGTNYATNNNVRMKTEYDSSTLLLGMRVSFDQPEEVVETAAVAPAPKPPEAPIARRYLVFFDTDQYTLSTEARAILRDAAMDALRGSTVGVEVRGHADTVGSKEYNMTLSQHRGESVENELVRLGIHPEAIGVIAMGENDPMVVTADGVAEPQNRRAEITYVIDPARLTN